jgi:pyridoxamine 5'-phosphate oxidase
MVEPPLPGEPLDETGADPDPLVQFGRWFEDASAVTASPEAMAVASADPDGHPSVRMVLLKSWGADGFVFFTNYDSRKGHELSGNPYTSLLFYWEQLGRQVRIDGPVERTTGEESDAYFATRPFASQVGAYASHQSRAIESRAALDAKVEAFASEYQGNPVPRPPWWGGMVITPRSFEFWQLGRNRLHDRLLYTPATDGWSIERLQP